MSQTSIDAAFRPGVAPPAGASGSVVRHRIARIYCLLISLNLLAWGCALLTFRHFPVLLGTAFLAYTFGLRHAVDADHIATIDNVTRKLMQQGDRPVAVGLFFSLGHSTVVLLASAAIAAGAAVLQSNYAGWREMVGMIGTSISALFLFAIALANMLVLRGVFRTFRRVKNGGRFVEEDLDMLLAGRGLLGQLFRPLLKLISKSWHMYPLGFLFGLGFDTATEIGVLGISAAAAAQGLPIWSILVFPALFTAGMTLVDTTDSVLMLGAYGWAFVKPIRKLYYNLTITFISVAIAVIVGSIEGLGVLGERLHLANGFWSTIGSLNAHFGMLGYLIVALLVISWLVSVSVYWLRGYDRIEVVSVEGDC